MRIRCRSLALAASALGLALPAAALTPLQSLRVSSDVAVVLGGATLADEAVVEDDLAGGVAPVDLGALPAATDLVAYHPLPNGDELLAFDGFVTLPGGVVAGAGDVVAYDGVGYSLAFDGTAAGVPAGARIDAVTHSGSALLVSFDVLVDLAGVIAADEDLVAFDGAGFSVFFDGSAAGMPDALDLDAAHHLPNGHLLVSLDGGGTLGGVVFADEDALELDPLALAWELAYDGSAEHAGWFAADLDALAADPLAVAPPGGTVQFAQAVFSALEGDGAATITVTRTGGDAGTLSVTFATGAGGTADAATPGVDFVPTSGSLTWTDGDSAPKTFTVELLDDALLEATETVPLALTPFPRSGTVLGDPAVATLEILDDDALPPTGGAIAVPTLSQWSLLLLAASLGAAGWRALRRTG